MTDSKNPLAEAEPDSLQHLFNTNPSTLTDAEFDLLIESYRKKRHLFMQSEQQEKKPKAAAGSKTRAPIGEIGNFEF